MAKSEFIKRQIALYKKFTPCFCPAIQDTVYFTSDGLNHILYHRRRPRKPEERHYRAGLIPYIIPVIQLSDNAIKSIKTNSPLIIIWVLSHEIVDRDRNKQIIKVVLVKEGAGKVKFLSVMRKKYIFVSAKTKKPE